MICHDVEKLFERGGVRIICFQGLGGGCPDVVEVHFNKHLLHPSNIGVLHRLTPQNGVHSFRYFLPEYIHHNPIVAFSCIYAFHLFSGVRIQV